MLLVRRAEVLQAGGGVARLRRCFELEQVDWLGVRGCGARVKAGVGGRRRESCVGAACSRGLVDGEEGYTTQFSSPRQQSYSSAREQVRTLLPALRRRTIANSRPPRILDCSPRLRTLLNGGNPRTNTDAEMDGESWSWCVA